MANKNYGNNGKRYQRNADQKEKKTIREKNGFSYFSTFKNKTNHPKNKKGKQGLDWIIEWEKSRQNETIPVPWKDSSLSAPLNW